MNDRPEWCSKCREYRPCGTCTYMKCDNCDRVLPSADLVAAVQGDTALPDSRMCWGAPDCEDLAAFYMTVVVHIDAHSKPRER